MAAREILFDRNARRQIARGLDALADAVKVTLGPRGRNVLLERPMAAPTVTKDGVTVARAIELEDHFANLGAQMVKEVAARTSEVAGDGTTTATVLAQAIWAEIQAGVIDATKVVRAALQNAASVVSLMLTTQALIAAPSPRRRDGDSDDPGDGWSAQT